MPSVAPKGRGRGRKPMADINMVPFIDVMLVLLIIFMVTAPLISPSVISLPSVGSAAKAPDRVIQVLIDKDEKLQIKEGKTSSPATLRDLASRVGDMQHSIGPSAFEVPVVIAADKSIKYETVVKVMDTLQRAGVQRVGLSVQTTP
ncbi:MAG: protein TolR [Polaromonas sp.]|nr:protein TolR [Polaromonas sp.]